VVEHWLQGIVSPGLQEMIAPERKSLRTSIESGLVANSAIGIIGLHAAIRLRFGIDTVENGTALVLAHG
jgi:hypothetical protein